MAHALDGEPVRTPDQVRGRLSPEHALIDTQEMAVACLLFTCPNTNLKVPTGVEMDVQGLRAYWKSTLKLDCPHCDAVHDVFVREVYVNSAIEGLAPVAIEPGRRLAAGAPSPRSQFAHAQETDPDGSLRSFRSGMRRSSVELAGDKSR